MGWAPCYCKPRTHPASPRRSKPRMMVATAPLITRKVAFAFDPLGVPAGDAKEWNKIITFRWAKHKQDFGLFINSVITFGVNNSHGSQIVVVSSGSFQVKTPHCICCHDGECSCWGMISSLFIAREPCYQNAIFCRCTTAEQNGIEKKL
jgi:hypothetical protein